MTKTCVDCGSTFQFSQDEQDFYRARSLADPKRCYSCRQAYKRKIGKGDQVIANECFECSPKLVKGVVVDADNKCLACGRMIEKSVSQYPVLAHHLRSSVSETEAVAQARQDIKEGNVSTLDEAFGDLQGGNVKA